MISVLHNKLIPLTSFSLKLSKENLLYDLFHLNLNGYGLAAVRDSSPYTDTHRQKISLGLQHMTFCSGVMMINMRYWREHDAYRLFKNFFFHRRGIVILPDQDALNYVFRDRWLMLPYKWGKTPLSIAPLDSIQKSFDIDEYVFKPCILHYSASVKPWMDVWQPDKWYYTKYLALSQFPNPQEIKLSIENKIKIYYSIIRYYINRSIRPIIPELFEIIIMDFFYLFKMIYSMSKGWKAFNSFLLRRWVEKNR